MTVAIKNYKAIVNAIPQLIEVSGYKNDYIAKKLNMRPGYFSAKKTKGGWSLEEVEKIIETIANKDVENYLDGLLVQFSFPGNTLSSADFEKENGMEVTVEELFSRQLAEYPKEFQEQFRKIYQHLKIADSPLEVKGVSRISKNFYKITVQNSRIALKVNVGKATTGLFLYNEHYTQSNNE